MTITMTIMIMKMKMIMRMIMTMKMMMMMMMMMMMLVVVVVMMTDNQLLARRSQTPALFSERGRFFFPLVETSLKGLGRFYGSSGADRFQAWSTLLMLRGLVGMFRSSRLLQSVKIQCVSKLYLLRVSKKKVNKCPSCPTATQ